MTRSNNAMNGRNLKLVIICVSLIGLALAAAQELPANSTAKVSGAREILGTGERTAALTGWFRNLPFRGDVTEVSPAVDAGSPSHFTSPGGEGPVPPFIRVRGAVASRPNEIVQLTIGIFNDQIGGDALWSQTQSIQTDPEGRYTVLLGSGTQGIPTILFSSGEAKWLEVSIDGNAGPRSQMISVPYAFKSSDADTLGGKPASAYLLADQVIGPNTPVTATSTDAQPLPPSDENFNRPHRPISRPFSEPTPSEFVTPQFFLQGLSLLPPSQAERGNNSGVPSSPLDLIGSAFNTATGSSENQTFRWQIDVVGSNTAVPSARLSLMFGSGKTAPQPTGFSLGSDGTLDFSPAQTISLASITPALTDAGLLPLGSNPAVPNGQPIVQTARYAWQQLGQGVLRVGDNILNLKPCPKGLDGTDLWHYLYISGTGVPEAVLMTGGTCRSGATAGTVEFMASNAHPAGFSIQSATGGVQEAFNDAITPKSDGQNSRSVLISPGDYLFHARLSIRSSSVAINASGAVITCAMEDTCVMLGDPSNSNTFQSISVQGLRLRPAIQSGIWAAVEDNAEGSLIADTGTAPNPSQTTSFGYLLRVDNDQNATIDRLTASLGRWGRCDSAFCSTAIYGAGGPGMSGVMTIKNSNLSNQCQANGIANDAGNTLHVTDTVVEGYPQFGIRSYGTYAVNPSVQLTNVYEEVGNCKNPNGTGTAGLIAQGGFVETSGGEGPAGTIPQFATSGTSTQYNYYIVTRSSTMGVSAPLLAGIAQTDGSSTGIRVLWDKIGKNGLITYDLLRTTGTDGWARPAPYGTGAYLVQGGITTEHCTNDVCSFIDYPGAALSTYIVADLPSFWPGLWHWPGSIILTQAGDVHNDGGSVPTRYYAQTITTTGGIVNSAGASQPSVFAQECDPMGNWSPIWMSCTAGNSLSNDYPPIVATVLQNSVAGGAPGGLKGRLNFASPPNSTIAASHIITLVDSDPAKTMATANNRPTWDPGDSFIGTDQPENVNPEDTQLSIGAGKAVSFYIKNVGDNVDWRLRLTNEAVDINAPVAAPAYNTRTNCVSAPGDCGAAAAGIVTIPAGATFVTVTDTAVTAKSEITLEQNNSYGALLGTSCDTGWRQYRTREIKPGASFVIETNSAPVSADCVSFSFVN